MKNENKDHSILKKQNHFIKWLKKNGIYDFLNSSSEMDQMMKLWLKSTKENEEKDAIINSLQQLVKRVIKDVEHHTDYSEGSMKYLDHECLSDQMNYIRERRAVVLFKARELGVELSL